jgi:tetratricopeptide (TPR) repeat protein
LFERAGSSGLPVAEAQVELAELRRQRGAWPESAALFESALDTRRAILGPNHPLVAEALNGLGLVHLEQGDLTSAEIELSQALEIRRKALLGDDPLIGQSLDNLAAARYAQHALKEAEALWREALAMHAKSDPRSWRVAICTLNLGVLCTDLGRLDEAAPLISEAQDLLRRLLDDRARPRPAGHPDLAEAMRAEAGLRLAQGDLDGAERLCEGALSMLTNIVGPDDPKLAPTYLLLGIIRRDARDYPASLASLERAAALSATDRTGNQAAHAHALRELAYLHLLLHQYDRAQTAYEATLRSLQARKPAPELDMAAVLDGLGYVLYRQQRSDPAEAHLRASLEIRLRLTPNASKEISDTQALLGLALLEQAQTLGAAKAREAEPILTESLRRRRDVYAGTPWRIGSSQSLLGACVALLGDFQRAEDLLLSGYDTIVNDPAAPEEPRSDAARRLVSLYERWQKPELATKWRARDQEP